MKKYLGLFSLFFFIGCATVVPVEPDPEAFTISEAKEVIKEVLFEVPFFKKVEVTEKRLSFVDTRESEDLLVIPYEKVCRTILKSGFVNGEYHKAILDLYYKDSQYRVHRVSIPCDSISLARKFVSALKKMALVSESGRQLAGLKP